MNIFLYYLFATEYLASKTFAEEKVCMHYLTGNLGLHTSFPNMHLYTCALYPWPHLVSMPAK